MRLRVERRDLGFVLGLQFVDFGLVLDAGVFDLAVERRYEPLGFRLDLCDLLLHQTLLALNLGFRLAGHLLGLVRQLFLLGDLLLPDRRQVLRRNDDISDESRVNRDILFAHTLLSSVEKSSWNFSRLLPSRKS